MLYQTMNNSYGWRIAWTLGITQTVGYGILYYTFAVFIVPMEAELGWQRAYISGALSLALLMSGVVAIPVGRWVDKRGARAMMTAGSLLGVCALVGWSYSTNLGHFYIMLALIGIAMAMSLYEVAFTVIAGWFRKKERASAMLIVTMIAGLASTIFIPLATVLLNFCTWREALRLLACLLALICIPLHVLMLRKAPQQLELHQASTANALRDANFWWLTLAFSLDRIVMIAIAAHGVPLLLERGYPPLMVASAAGSIGLMQTLGRFAFTPAIQRFSLLALTVATFGFHVLALLCLQLPYASALWCFAAFFGIANGASTLVRAALLADIYGSANYGSINGTMAMVMALAQTVTPLAIGFFYDSYGSYRLVLWLLVAVAVSAMLAMRKLKLEGKASPT